MKLIDKDALVAEIERMLQDEYACENSEQQTGYNCALFELQHFLNTLEVKDVDLEEALSKLDKDIKEFVTTEEFEKESKTCGHYWAIAKHAFLLGLKAQKGE